MGIKEFFVTKLLGYNIFKEKENLRVSLNNAQRNMASLYQNNNLLQQNVDANKQKIAHLSKEIEKKEIENDKLIASISIKQAEVDRLMNTLCAKDKEIDSLSVNAERLDIQRRSNQKQFEEIEKENECIKNANKNLADQIDALKQENTNTSMGIRELEAQIQKNEETIQTKIREIECLNNEKDGIRFQFDDVCNELKKVRSEKESLSERLSKLEEQNEAIQDKYDAISKYNDELHQKLDALKKKVSEEKDLDREGPAVIEPEKNPKKTKVEEIIEQSGGSIEDFPAIINDSTKNTQRTIEYVFDENDKKVCADEFFGRSVEEIAQVSRKMSEAQISGQKYWTCGHCRHRVKIAHRTYRGEEALFFVHATRKHDCPWLIKNIGPKSPITDGGDTVNLPQDAKVRELKEKIYCLLTSQTSIDIGISDVKKDEVICSTVAYMRWRRPDISFVFKGRRMVIELQKKSHGIDTIVDRDVFFRLNNIQILWIFGSDSDSSYDYMRGLNYKNTMFDNHRNVFVFDKEAQSVSEENDTLFLKCNWLNDDDAWHFRIENSGTNGKMVELKDLVFEDEYCKPYYYDANEEYFLKHPEARDAYLATKMTREELKKAIEDKWTRDPNYEEAQAQMHQRNAKATLYRVKDLWGFRFNATIIIPPIFTVEPKDLYNGYYLVQQGDNFGIVDYFGEKVVGWDGLISCEGMNYDSSNKLVHFKRNGLWGVADLSAKELMSPFYQTVVLWTNNVYKVQKNNKWGLCNLKNELICNCFYNKIENVVNGRAIAVKAHPAKDWMTVTGYIDTTGKELYSSKSEQGDGLFIIQKFELWGIVDENDCVVIPCQYEGIKPWANHLYRVKENGKWGVFNVEKQEFLLNATYDSIGDLQNGVAITEVAKRKSAIDISGQEVAQEIVQLQKGLKKTKIAGKWGIVDSNDEIIINHQYDEIGSFRSRMIGVINGRIIKLDANYEYPIFISGKYLGKSYKSHLFNVAGVKCMIPEAFLRQMNKTIEQLCDNEQICNQLAFANLVFSKKSYILRVLNSERLTHRLSHADGKDDFPLGEVLNGKITSFKTYARMGTKRRTKAMVEFSDGKQSMVPRRFFNASHPIDEYKVGDVLLLKKTGYDEELDQTIWDVQQRQESGDVAQSISENNQ